MYSLMSYSIWDLGCVSTAFSIINSSINFLLNLVIRKLNFHQNHRTGLLQQEPYQGRHHSHPHTTQARQLLTHWLAFTKISTINHCKWNCRGRQGLGACWDHAGFILFYAGSSLGLSSIIFLVLFKYHPISRRNPVPHHLSWRFCIKLHFQLRNNSHGDLARLVPERRGSL